MFDFKIGDIYVDKYSRKHLVIGKLDDPEEPEEIFDNERQLMELGESGYRFSSACDDGQHYYIKPSGELMWTHGADDKTDESARSQIISLTDSSFENRVKLYEEFGLRRHDAVDSVRKLNINNSHQD